MYTDITFIITGAKVQHHYSYHFINKCIDENKTL